MEEYLVIAAIAYLISNHKSSLKFRNWLWNKAVIELPHSQYPVKAPEYKVKNQFYALWYGLVSCPFCIGWWEGIIYNSFQWNGFLSLIFNSLCTAIVSTILVKLT